jgi:hypothetical protein
MPLTDGTRARRFPYVTTLLIAANLIVWIFYELRTSTRRPRIPFTPATCAGPATRPCRGA